MFIFMSNMVVYCLVMFSVLLVLILLQISLFSQFFLCESVVDICIYLRMRFGESNSKSQYVATTTLDKVKN